MPFNANTYRMNRYRREAKQHLAAARAIKARAAVGQAYAWELSRIAFHVAQVRLCMRLYLSCRAIKALDTTARNGL